MVMSRREFGWKVPLAVAGVSLGLYGCLEKEADEEVWSGLKKYRGKIGERPRVEVIDPLERLVTSVDVKGYVGEHLNEAVPGCEYFTYGKLLTNGKVDGFYAVEPEVFKRAFVTASDLEKYFFGKVGKKYFCSNAMVGSFCRPPKVDKKMPLKWGGEVKSEPGTHAQGIAADVFVFGMPTNKLYTKCESDWEGGLFRYVGEGAPNILHIDERGERMHGVLRV